MPRWRWTSSGRCMPSSARPPSSRSAPRNAPDGGRPRAWPLLERLRAWVQEIGPTVPPSTPLGKAIRYVERGGCRWSSSCSTAGSRSTTGRSSDRSAASPSGAANWLFTKGDAAARRLCTVASLCATCRRLGIDPWAYLRDALLAAGSGIRARELAVGFTPWAWAEKQAKQPDAEKLPLAV